MGNALGRWGKHYILQGPVRDIAETTISLWPSSHDKNDIAQRIHHLFDIVKALKELRNYDLAFHIGGSFLWELLPDVASKCKVDLTKMIDHCKVYSDRKWWNTEYQRALESHQSMIPLLVYHSNLISGGFGGSESIIQKKWENTSTSYINVAKFRSVSRQQELLSDIATWDREYAHQSLRDFSVSSPLYSYFDTLRPPTDSQLAVMRSEIVPLSRHRQSGKITSLEQWSSSVMACVSARERRVAQWTQLVERLNTDEEIIKLRDCNHLVCCRDAHCGGRHLALYGQGRCFRQRPTLNG